MPPPDPSSLSQPSQTPASAAGPTVAPAPARPRRKPSILRDGALQGAILNSADFSIIATDEAGIIRVFNPGAERMLGYRAAEVINRVSPSDLHDPGEVLARARALSLELATPITPGFDALSFKAARDIEDVYELTYIRKDGSRFPAMVSITALRDTFGGIIGYLIIGTDNSTRKRAELELRGAMDAAEKANLAKTDFLSSMSHELRTPLNSILGFAQLLRSGTPPPTPDQGRDLDRILKAGWYLLEMINEVLDLAVIESGKATLSREPVALAEVLRECHAMIEPEARKRGIVMTFAQVAEACFVSADRTRLKQVLLNLLFNAIKYNRPAGAVEVACAPDAAGAMRIRVIDSGWGLSPAEVAQLFQPFNRLGKETGAEEGTGIGLVVTRRLVELMGGRIGVESKVDKGTTFWIELALTQAPRLALAAGTTAMLPAAPQTGPLRTVLCVEDNPANLELIERLIARRGDVRVLSAADGSIGITMARALQPTLILMDINLPGLSGIEAMKVLRADASTAHIPIVALSANAMPQDVQRGLAAGFSGYLTKPIHVERFMEALDKALAAAPAPTPGNDHKEPK